jgi:biotin carboxylase
MVGRRKGAVAAAERCGWEPIVIDVPARDEQAAGAFGGSASWAVEKVSALCPDSPPVGVAAVATGSVVAAAVVRELLGLQGISRETALRCHDKLVMKRAIAAASIPCAPWRETSADTTAEELVESLGLPVVLKMPISSGGRGVWICQTVAELATRLRPGLLAEGFVSGTEMSIETFRAGGITVFRNPTQYLKPRWANIVPARLTGDDPERIDSMAERVHDALGITSGISHMEIFLTADGPVFGEIAARPPGGFIMELIHRSYGFDPWEAVLRISAGEKPRFPDRAKQFSGVWLLHPGGGRITAVNGVQEARAIPNIVDITCRIQPGQVTTQRIGSGDNGGRITASAPSQQACAAALREAANTVQFSLSEPFVKC